MKAQLPLNLTPRFSEKLRDLMFDKSLSKALQLKQTDLRTQIWDGGQVNPTLCPIVSGYIC